MSVCTASASHKGNVVTITFPPGIQLTVRSKTNSKLQQKVSLKDKSGAVNYEFTGTGEKNTVIGETSIKVEPDNVFTGTFEYLAEDGSAKPSQLNCGGPYAIGAYNLLVIVSENGDDSDYNDAILEFSWYTNK